MGHSREALRVRRELDRELAEAAESVRRELVWSTAERVNLDSIMFTIDRVVVLRRAFAAARDTRQRTKLSAELRLLETNVSRLTKLVRTDIPQPMSVTSPKAQRAANTRWDRERASG